MASKASRLPKGQQREKEKDGRIRRFLCDVLTQRVLAYVAAQPPSFAFILSLLCITLAMPPMSAYIKNAGPLPDLDTMRSWNAYLGRLPSQRLCIVEHASRNVSILEAASAFIDFHVDKSVLTKADGRGVAMAVGDFTGLQLKTKIKNSGSRVRIDENVTVTLFLPLNASNCTSSGECRVQGCVDIRAPLDATPSRHPQIPHTDYSFGTRVLHSRNKPDGPTDGARMLCSTYYKSEILNATWELSLSDKCRDVKPDREHYRKKGLINIYLTQEQQQQSYRRVLLGTLGMAAVGVAFAVGIGCTDRPPKPKNSPE